ncbi:MAG TPA: hypothetical protein VJ249_02745 [Candidatus Bathyarchaeia archaeon]|nr:hypothetical protein [Candidatus Bathyarchaeia archaeon]
MRGRTKVISLAAMLLVIFATSAIFTSGLVDVSRLSLFSTPIVPNQVPTVYVDPATIIMDYVNDPGFQIGDLLQVSVNITDATDVFSYQVNVTWTTSMLNFTRVVSYGDFLAQTGSPYGTSRIEPTFIASNATGSASVAETILGDVAGVGGGGRLFTLEFLILDYGCANITISSGGDLPTMLLDSAGATISFSSADGYFKNKLFGDANSDRIVDIFDAATLSSRWTGAPGALPYSRCVDNNDDGVIDIFDAAVTSANWGRTA